MTWVDVGDVAQLKKSGKTVLDVDGREILVLAHDGTFYGFANRCIHKDRELVRGVVLNGKLVCPGHQWAFALDTGWESIKQRCQPTFPVRVVDDRVEIDIAPSAQQVGTPADTPVDTPVRVGGDVKQQQRTTHVASKAGLDVGLVTNDIAAMRAFYTDAIGLEYVESLSIPWGTMHRLRFGVSWLKLVDPTTPAAPSGSPGLDASTGIRYLTFEIDNIEAIWEQAIATGARVFHALGAFGTQGVTMGMLHDPDGNVVELLHRPTPISLPT